jgi:lipopolysaccharide export system permease protein
MLFSACTVYGRMSAFHEITAIKSLGISPAVILRPVTIIALVVSLVSAWLTDIAYTTGHYGVKRVIASSVDEIAYSVLRNQRNYTLDQFAIHVQGVDGRRLLQPTIVVNGSGGREPTVITAREATLRSGASQDELIFVLTDGSAEFGDSATFRFHDTIEHTVQLGGHDPDDLETAHPSHMRSARIPAAIRHQRQQISRVEQSLAVEAATHMAMGDFVSFTGPSWKQQTRLVRASDERLHRLRTERYRRWASGFSCLCFAVVGAPLAIRLRTSDHFTTFGICFLPILLVYYPFFAYGLEKAKTGALPPYCVWLANLVTLCVGAWLYRHAIRR